MQKKDLFQNYSSIFSKHEIGLRYVEDEDNNGFIVDDNENKIRTFPILFYEEKHLFANDSESYINLSICSYGKCTDATNIKSTTLLKSNTFISRFGIKPFAAFNERSWEIFFCVITALLLEIELKEVYHYSGWNKGFDRYIYGRLLTYADNTIPIQNSLVKTDTILSKKTDADICRNLNDIFRNISRKELLGYIFVIYLLLGHSKQRFVEEQRIGPEFVLSILGRTNSYKTATATAIYNSHNGSVSSFEDTLASICRMLKNNKSGVTIIDDYKISSLRNDEKYEKIVRLSSDVQTTGKYVVGNKVVDESITGMNVITGEKRPQLQQSSYARILFVDLEKYPINLNYLTQLQNSEADINSFIVLFIKLILKKDNFDSYFVELFKKYREELYEDEDFKGMYGRYYSMFGWLAAAWDVYKILLEQYGISVEFDFKSEIKSYIYSQHCMYDNNPIMLFKKGYMELLNSNEIIVVDNNCNNELNFDVIQYEDKLFLKSNGAYKKICRFWSEKGIDFSCSERKLRQYLHDAEILEVRNGKYTIEKKTRDNRSYSGYYLYKNIFLNYGGNKDDEF